MTDLVCRETLILRGMAQPSVRMQRARLCTATKAVEQRLRND